MLKAKTVYEIETGAYSKKTLTPNQLLALHLWLIRAARDPDILPLQLFGQDPKWFAWRAGEVIRFQGQADCLSIDSVLKLIKAIKAEIVGLPDQTDYNSIYEDSLYEVRGYGDKLFGYINVKTKGSLMRVALRHWEEGKCWYGVIADTFNNGRSECTFSDLSLGQI